MRLLFQNRDGQTPINSEMKYDLKLSHINDMTELYEQEMQNIALANSWCEKTKKDHKDYLVWEELHKKMFCDVWKWAGKIRIRELQNADFLMPYEVSPALLKIKDDLTFWLDKKTFSERELMARFHERLLTIHPFNDGNGRWSRLLVEFVCSKECFEIPNWGAEIASDSERRQKYIEAVKKARHKDDMSDLISIMYYKKSRVKK